MPAANWTEKFWHCWTFQMVVPAHQQYMRALGSTSLAHVPQPLNPTAAL
jgi:hypothetical protein